MRQLGPLWEELPSQALAAAVKGKPEGSTHSAEHETEAKSQSTPQLLPLG